VTAVTFQCRVFPGQGPIRLDVIKLLLRRLPLDEGKLLTIVLGVVTGAGLAAGALGHGAGVEAAPGGDRAGDFAVAVQALERGLPAEAMTACTVRRALQETVRAGEGAGRDLCQSGRGAQHEGSNTGQAQHGQDAKSSAPVSEQSFLQDVLLPVLATHLELQSHAISSPLLSP
jgi:hypothetical protein